MVSTGVFGQSIKGPNDPFWLKYQHYVHQHFNYFVKIWAAYFLTQSIDYIPMLIFGHTIKNIEASFINAMSVYINNNNIDLNRDCMVYTFKNKKEIISNRTRIYC